MINGSVINRGEICLYTFSASIFKLYLFLKNNLPLQNQRSRYILYAFRTVFFVVEYFDFVNLMKYLFPIEFMTFMIGMSFRNFVCTLIHS